MTLIERLERNAKIKPHQDRSRLCSEAKAALEAKDAEIERLTAACKAFVVHAIYPVSKEINPRGYAWRGEEALDHAKRLADEALEQGVTK
jgi:hypothetical protein